MQVLVIVLGTSLSIRYLVRRMKAYEKTRAGDLFLNRWIFGCWLHKPNFKILCTFQAVFFMSKKIFSLQRLVHQFSVLYIESVSSFSLKLLFSFLYSVKPCWCLRKMAAGSRTYTTVFCLEMQIWEKVHMSTNNDKWILRQREQGKKKAHKNYIKIFILF